MDLVTSLGGLGQLTRHLGADPIGLGPRLLDDA